MNRCRVVQILALGTLTWLFCSNGFARDFYKIDSEPFLVLGDPTSENAPFFKPMDVEVYGDIIYILDVDERKIIKMNFQGKVLSSFSRKGSGPGELLSSNNFALVGDTLWVPDRRLGRVSFFRNDKFVGTLKDNPIADAVSIVAIGKQVYLSGTSVLQQGIAVFNSEGKYLKTIPWQSKREILGPLWGGARLFSHKDLPVVGFIYDNALGFLDENGNIGRVKDMADFYPRYVLKENNIVYPNGYSAYAFSEGPDDTLMVGPCSKETRSCPTVYQLDKDLKGILGKRTFSESIIKIKYFPKEGFMVMVDRDGLVSFYGTH